MFKIIKAISFATDSHAKQLRKYTNVPYVMHCFDVANILISHGYTEEYILCAAVLHDTVEDTFATHYDIEDIFGKSVSELVCGLTDISKPDDGNRKIRKQIDRDHLFNQSSEVQIIKCADLISNSKDIAKHDKGFAKVYMTEKELLLEGMHKCVKETLIYKKAQEIVNAYNKAKGSDDVR